MSRKPRADDAVTREEDWAVATAPGISAAAIAAANRAIAEVEEIIATVGAAQQRAHFLLLAKPVIDQFNALVRTRGGNRAALRAKYDRLARSLTKVGSDLALFGDGDRDLLEEALRETGYPLDLDDAVGGAGALLDAAEMVRGKLTGTRTDKARPVRLLVSELLDAWISACLPPPTLPGDAEQLRNPDLPEAGPFFDVVTAIVRMAPRSIRPTSEAVRHTFRQAVKAN